MRRQIIGGNWKLNKTVPQSIGLAKGIKENLSEYETEVVVCPVFTALSEVNEVIKDSPIQLGAQDVYWEPEGAFTGEVSPKMLKDVGCDYVIVGHSERRQYFNETNETVNKKLKASLDWGLKVIICVGETLEERKAGNAFDVVGEHLKEGLKDLDVESIEKKLVVAYEPVWAIGTGESATAEQAQEMHKFTREVLANIFDGGTSDKIRIQYGGSVKPHNAKKLLTMSDIDGSLVGGASLKPDSFSEIIKISNRLYAKK